MSACLLQEVFPPFFLGTQDIVSEFQRGSERGSELASSATLFCAVINARRVAPSRGVIILLRFFLNNNYELIYSPFVFPVI